MILGAVSFATGLLVHEYMLDAVVTLGKFAQLVRLVLRVLSFVFRRDAGADSYCIGAGQGGIYGAGYQK